MKILNQLARITSRVRHGAKPPSYFMPENPAYSKYSIGRMTYGYPNVLDWNDGSRLKVGSFCSIGPEVTILLSGEHHSNWCSMYPLSAHMRGCENSSANLFSKGDVLIGNDVWIGCGSTILSGVEIGDGAVIGAGAVVAKNVEPYSVIVGNPPRHLRYRIPQTFVVPMQQIAWWNWDDDKIRAAAPLLLSSDIGAFVTRYSAQQREVKS